jgi:hypothetical protein
VLVDCANLVAELDIQDSLRVLHQPRS